MKAKYCPNTHLSEANLPSKCSHVWRRMLSIRLIADRYIQWIVGQGNINATRDKWFQSSPLHHVADLQIHDLFTINSPNQALIITLVGLEEFKEIVDQNINLSQEKDISIWSITPSGGFSITSVWETLRGKGIPSTLNKWCQSKHINGPTLSSYPQRSPFSSVEYFMVSSLLIQLLKNRNLPSI